MNARTVAARLRAEGISAVAHRDGTVTASLMKPREESWIGWLRSRVASLAGAAPYFWGEWATNDPRFARAVVKVRMVESGL